MRRTPPKERDLLRENQKERCERKRREVVQVNICHKAVEAWDRLLHRSVAALLAAAMTLSFLPATSWAVSPITPPTQITEATKSEFPKIEFQTNFVRTEYGSLTGLMELAIRVGPSGTTTVDGKEVAVPVDFQSVAATLQYNTTLFQPISWQWAFGEMGEATPIDIDLKTNVTSYYDVQIPAKKDDSLPGTGAIAQCGVVDPAPTGMSTNVTSGEQALLFFKAEAYGPAITIAEMTTLAVVRFYVNPALMEHISILRDKVTGDYSVLFDGKKAEADWITNQAKLDAAIKTVAATGGTVTPDPDPTPSLDPTPSTRDTATLTLPTDFISVGFAMDGDMARSKSPADMSLHYSTGGNEFYYVPGCNPTEPDPDKNDKLENVPTELGPKGSQVTVDLPAPKTDGERVLAVAENAPTDSTNAADYSYLSNLIPAANISFPVVSQLSFADNGDGRENMATVLFYDWDDTLIGVLVVPRNDDARALVNEYVRDNMIHPDLRFTVGSTTQTTDITSLARQDTYRGKYPSTPMADGGKDTTMDGNRPATPEGNDKLVGSDYPLTNKLDYVFLKRPMTQTAKGTTATGEPTSTWTQPGTTGDVEWDDEYPYIHGWALIPDEDLTDIQYTHPENLWTTVGLGELGTYNGAANGGYRAMNGAPAVLTATGEEFELANFDFYANPQPKGTVYAVKAIYEPGESLLPSGRRYRMISEPYYNKLNAPSADAGGAYSVDVVFERASTEVDDLLQGVARIREPGVRQDTTTDLKWEENEELGIEHNLLNATIREAYTSKSKTTYTKIEIANTEEIPISLTLSARQNKVDYYIKEMYNSNFVVGGARTENDNNRAGLAKTLDNYNYRVTESNLTDEWYDAQYSDRDGSYGFVLIGTLHQLMELATQCNEGKLAKDDLYSYVTDTTLIDINLRLDADGRTTESFEDIEAVVDALLAAAEDAKKNHYRVAGYWNSDPAHDCAELNYHQLQLFVIDYMPDKSASLLSPSAADAVIVKWCHLHEECVAKTSGKPRNWSELISTAQGSDTDAEKLRKISLLTAVEMEDIAHLRSDINGTAFATVDAFAAKVLAAVKAGNTSWDAVQGHILGQNAAYAKAYAWWYDGTTSVSLDNLNQLINTTPDAFTAVTLPDGVKETRQGKLNQLLPAFTANGALAGDETDPDWVRATENLCADSDAGKFADFDTFKAAFLAALKKGTDAAAAVGDPELYPETWRPTWNQLQYAILHPSEAFPLVPTTAQENEFKTYYWHNGGRKVTDVASMLLAAQRANQGETASWEAFDFDALYTYPGLQLRKDFKGTQYTSTEFVAFKNTILTLAGQGTNRTWEQVQYYLIHGSLGGSVAVNGESPYYWWKDGEVGESVDFSTITDYNTGLSVFLDAAFRAEINGNAHAWDGLTAAFDKVKTARLIKKDNDATTFDTLEHFVSATEFLTAINGISAAAGAKGGGLGQNIVKPDSNTVTWQQMQKYLFDKTLTLAGDEDYWWRNADSKGSEKTPEDYLNEIRTALQDVFDRKDYTAINLWVKNLENVNAIFLYEGGDKFSQSDVDYAVENAADLWGELVDSGDYSSAAEVSWYQFEYAIFAGGYSGMSDADVMDELVNDYDIEIPSWVPAPAMVLTSRPNRLAARRPATSVKTDEETGITTVTTTTNTELEDGTTLRVETVTTRDPVTNEVVTITTTTLLDADGNVLSQAVSEPVVAPAETETPACTCGSEDGTHAGDCPLYVPPTETEEPTEPPETAESAEPSESPEETVAPEPSESPEPTVSPEPTESSSPEEELPEPSTPGAETPEVPPTQEPAESETPDGPVGPQESESLEVTVTPEGTLETMPEIIDPDPPASEPPGDSEEETADKSAGTEETTTSPPPSQEAVVIETQPPLVGTINLRSPSVPMVYNKLTTKIAPIKLFTSAGGRNMKQLKLNRIFSPPGRPLSGAVPLRLRTENKERGCAV